MSYRTAADRNQPPRIRKTSRSEARRRTRRAAFGRAMSRTLRLEPMEARLLLATLVFNGDQDMVDQNDTFQLQLNAVDDSLIDIVQNGVLVDSQPTADLTINVNGLGGNDTLVIDQSNGLIIVPVNYDGGDGDDLLVHMGDPGIATLTGEYTPGLVAGSGVLQYSDGAGTITFTGLEPVEDLVPAASLTVNDSANADVINIVDGPTSTAIDPITGVTEETYQVDFAGAAESILFRNKVELIVNGQTGSDAITLDVAGPSTGDALDQIQINGGDGFDTIDVDRIDVGTLLAITGGADSDAITLTTSNGAADTITPAVTVDGGGDVADALTIDDRLNTFNDTWIVSGSSVDRVAFGGVTYSGLATLDLLAQNLVGATVDVESTSIETAINTGGGNDTVEISPTAGDLSTIAGNLTVNTGSGTSDRVILWDNSNVSATSYNITDNAVAGPNPGTIGYSGAEFLEFTAGSGADSLIVDPSLLTAYSIHGSAPTSLPGDGMTVDVTGGARLDVTGPGDGTITFYGGMKPIDFTSIESVDAVNGVFDLGIVGTPGTDAFLLMLDAAGTNIQLSLGGVLVFDAPADATKSLTVLGLGGEDTLTIDGVNGLPTFTGCAGNWRK